MLTNSKKYTLQPTIIILLSFSQVTQGTVQPPYTDAGPSHIWESKMMCKVQSRPDPVQLGPVCFRALGNIAHVSV